MLDNNLYISKEFIASLDNDGQCGFSILCPKELVVPKALEIVGPLNQQATLASRRIATRDYHPEKALWHTDNPKLIGTQIPGLAPGSNIDKYWPKHCLANTKGAELLPGLPPIGTYHYVVTKGIDPDAHAYGACYHDLHGKQSTGLIEVLYFWKIEVVIVGGLATEYCVFATAMQLRRAGFTVILNLSACRGIDPIMINRALDEMRKAGIIIALDFEDVKEKLRAD